MPLTLLCTCGLEAIGSPASLPRPAHPPGAATLAGYEGSALNDRRFTMSTASCRGGCSPLRQDPSRRSAVVGVRSGKIQAPCPPARDRRGKLGGYEAHPPWRGRHRLLVEVVLADAPTRAVQPPARAPGDGPPFVDGRRGDGLTPGCSRTAPPGSGSPTPPRTARQRGSPCGRAVPAPGAGPVCRPSATADRRDRAGRR